MSYNQNQTEKTLWILAWVLVWVPKWSLNGLIKIEQIKTLLTDYSCDIVITCVGTRVDTRHLRVYSRGIKMD